MIADIAVRLAAGGVPCESAFERRDAIDQCEACAAKLFVPPAPPLCVKPLAKSVMIVSVGMKIFTAVTMLLLRAKNCTPK